MESIFGIITTILMIYYIQLLLHKYVFSNITNITVNYLSRITQNKYFQVVTSFAFPRRPF